MRPASLVRERGLQLLQADFAVPVSENFQSKFHLEYKSVQVSSLYLCPANDLRRAMGKADAGEKLFSCFFSRAQTKSYFDLKH